jgi:hypothetical protein
MRLEAQLYLAQHASWCARRHIPQPTANSLISAWLWLSGLVMVLGIFATVWLWFWLAEVGGAAQQHSSASQSGQQCVSKKASDFGHLQSLALLPPDFCAWCRMQIAAQIAATNCTKKN